MRRLEGEQEAPICQTQPLSSSTLKTGVMEAHKTTSANATSSRDTPEAGADPWKNIPLPSMADPSEQHVMGRKTLLECCKCAKAHNQEHELSVEDDATGVSILRTMEHRRVILKELDDLCDAAKDKNWGKYLLGLADVLYRTCNLMQEVGLETVLSPA